MTHDQVLSLVSDWVRGRLDRERAREVESHARTCRDCQQAADAARRLAGETARLDETALAHPPADVLARYVSEPDSESVATLARVGAHLRGCETCREDVALMRAAGRPGWWRALRAAWGAPGAGARALHPALALAAVLLAYPAWRGLVEWPRERAAAERRVRAAEDELARARGAARGIAARPSPGARGGGVAALVLQGAARDAGPTPTLRLRRGQPFQPILLDVTPPPGPLAVTLARGDAVVWSSTGSREEYWDDVNRLVGLLVPADALAPGEHRLELRQADARTLVFAATFLVVAGATPETSAGR